MSFALCFFFAGSPSPTLSASAPFAPPKGRLRFWSILQMDGAFSSATLNRDCRMAGAGSLLSSVHRPASRGWPSSSARCSSACSSFATASAAGELGRSLPPWPCACALSVQLLWWACSAASSSVGPLGARRNGLLLAASLPAACTASSCSALRSCKGGTFSFSTATSVSAGSAAAVPPAAAVRVCRFISASSAFRRCSCASTLSRPASSARPENVGVCL
mmetsp:Transcript_6972/g.25684  ORF Transcript_6972/g.25684 Transcript_6972/m.25684 type:complete len:219 (+) Transcript_6972:724-1380(+)